MLNSCCHSFTYLCLMKHNIVDTFFINQVSEKLARNKQPMSRLFSFLTTIIILLLISYATAQNPVADCGPNLLPLAPCGPFVQGIAAKPVQTCCDNLNQLYKQKPTCLCLLLNHTSSLPINTTLALRLPVLCSLHILPSTCPGISVPSFGSNPKPGVAGGISSSPILTAPRPRFMGFGFPHNGEERFKAQVPFLTLLTAATFTLL